MWFEDRNFPRLGLMQQDSRRQRTAVDKQIPEQNTFPALPAAVQSSGEALSEPCPGTQSPLEEGR